MTKFGEWVVRKLRKIKMTRERCTICRKRKPDCQHDMRLLMNERLTKEFTELGHYRRVCEACLEKLRGQDDHDLKDDITYCWQQVARLDR